MALVALTLSCATQHIDLQAAEKHYDLAADYMGKRLVAAALRECEEALKANPNYADAHYLLGAIKLGLAVQDLEVAGRTSCLKGPQAALGKKGAEDKLREAEAHFKHASELRVDYSEALDGLAAIALHFQDWDRAVALEASALKNPVFAENHIARSNLAWALYGKGDYVRAELELRSALVRAPDFCVGYYRLGELLFKRGDVPGASDALGEIEKRRQVCRIQEAFHLLGRVAVAHKEPVRALKALEDCQSLAPRSCLADECKKLAITIPPQPRPPEGEGGDTNEEG